MDGVRVSSTKRSTDESVKVQGDGGCVFFFDWKGIVHHEFVPRGQMVNEHMPQSQLLVIISSCKESDDTHSAGLEIYDTAHEKWEKDFYAGEARENAEVVVIGNKTVFVNGRKSNNQFSHKVDIYDANEIGSRKCWKTRTIGETRKNVAVPVVGDKAIFFWW